jgi:hypothetical protein
MIAIFLPPFNQMVLGEWGGRDLPNPDARSRDKKTPVPNVGNGVGKDFLHERLLVFLQPFD